MMQTILLFLLLGPLQEPSSDVVTDTTPQPDLRSNLIVTSLDFDFQGAARFPSFLMGPKDESQMFWYAKGEREGETVLRSREWGEEGWGPLLELARGGEWFVNWADFAKVQADADGGAVMTWLAHSKDKKGYGVMYQKRRESGSAWTDPAPLHLDREGVEHGFVSMAPLGDGRFFCTWLQSTADGPPTEMRYTVLGADGSPGPEFVLDDRVCDCCSTATVVLPSGNVLVAYRDRTEDEVRDIHLVRGIPGKPETWSGPMAMDNDHWTTESCPVNGPVMINKGSFVALAYYHGGVGGHGKVLYRLSRGGGKRFGFPTILAGGKDCLGRVSIAFLPNGTPVVSWLEIVEEQAQWVARALPRKGHVGEKVVIAKVKGTRKNGVLQLASVADGILAAWTGDEGDSLHLAKLELEPLEEQ